MKQYIAYQIDVFTKEKFRGNPAGVILNADGLTVDNMQLIARELNNSETAFIFETTDSSYDVGIRYFTPIQEVPICGHATIAAIYAKAIEEQWDTCIIKIKTSVGVLPLKVIKHGSDYEIIMTQGDFEIKPELDEVTITYLLNALGLETSDIAKNCPIQIASTGHSKVMVGIKSKKKLDQITPDMNALIQLSKQINCNGYFVFTLDSDNSNILTHGRMFAPAIGINEDPVTGNANGPLGGYLIQNKIVGIKEGCFEFMGRQGEHIGRTGDVLVRVEISNQVPTKIQIKGNAITVFRTIIEL